MPGEALPPIPPRRDAADWGAMTWLAEDALAPGLPGGLGLSLARMTLNPGATSPAHRHPDCHEVVHLLQGRVALRRDTTWTPLAAGDSLAIPAGTVHALRNEDDGEAVLMVAYSAGARTYEAVGEG